MGSKNIFDEAKPSHVSQASPGIVEEVIDCGYNIFDVRSIKAPYSTVRMGMVLSAMEDIDYLEEKDRGIYCKEI